jgi:hypothetical protein
VDTTSETNYPHGSFLYPYDNIRIFIKTLFGSISDETDTTIILKKYDAPIPSENLATEITEPLTTVIQDMYDSSLFIKKEETFIKEDPLDNYSITEFLDNTHTEVGETGGITLNSGKVIYRQNSITNPITLDNFMKNFDTFDHYITEGFTPNNITAFRGNIVPEEVFKQLKLKTMKNMISNFMEKRYDNFLFDNNFNIMEDNTFMKMRIFAEGYQKLINSDRNLKNLNLANKGLISYNELPSRILLFKDDKSSDYLRKIGEVGDTKYLRKEYDPDFIYISNKLNQENIFTKLIEYNKFPTDDIRKKYLSKQSKRLQAYSDFTKITRVLDDKRVAERIYKENTSSLLEYKNFIIYNLLENFYAYNNYSGDDKYLKNYKAFLKDKISNESVYSIKTSEQTEKMSYLKDNLIESELLQKILVEDWKVL